MLACWMTRVEIANQVYPNILLEAHDPSSFAKELQSFTLLVEGLVKSLAVAIPKQNIVQRREQLCVAMREMSGLQDLYIFYADRSGVVATKGTP